MYANFAAWVALCLCVYRYDIIEVMGITHIQVKENRQLRMYRVHYGRVATLYKRGEAYNIEEKSLSFMIYF